MKSCFIPIALRCPPEVAAGVMQALHPCPLHGTGAAAFLPLLAALPPSQLGFSVFQLWWNKFLKWQVVRRQCKHIPYLKRKFADNSNNDFRKSLYIFQSCVVIFYYRRVIKEITWHSPAQNWTNYQFITKFATLPQKIICGGFFDWITYIGAIS